MLDQARSSAPRAIRCVTPLVHIWVWRELAPREPMLISAVAARCLTAYQRRVRVAQWFRGLARASAGCGRAQRLLARQREGVTPAAPVVVRDELQTGSWSSHCRIPEVAETFYAIV